jgi:phosphoglycolate phosphatase
MKQNNLFFDLDGTLTDSAEGILKSAAYALEHFGIRVEDLDTLRPFLGPPLWDSFMQFYGFSREEADRAVAVYRERFAEVGIFENRPYPGVEGMLERLKDNGKQIFLATSKPEIYAKRILEHFGLTGYFSGVTGSALDGSLVKKGDVLRRAMDLSGAERASSVMIGDRKHDVLGAEENKIPCIGVLYGYGSREELIRAGADILADSVEELEQILLEK